MDTSQGHTRDMVNKLLAEDRQRLKKALNEIIDNSSDPWAINEAYTALTETPERDCYGFPVD